MTRYLSPQQVLFLHYNLIQSTGGLHGVLDLSMLLSAVHRPLAAFEGNEFYPSLFSKAAALMDSLVRNHPFVDGNKRTAISAAALFLQINGYRLIANDDQVIEFTLACAQSQLTLQQITDWFIANCIKVGD